MNASISPNKSQKPLVSIIVPNYNYARYLPQRMASILNQTYSHFELILLDDCSQDDSVEYLKHLSQSEGRVIRLVINEKNSGSPFRQWQKGLDLAVGDYVWIAEADDYADVSFLEKAVEVMERYPTASLAFCGSHLVNTEGELLETDMDHWTDKQLNNKVGYKLFPGMNYIKSNLYWYNYIYNASGVLFRRLSYMQVTDFGWMGMRYCGDWCFWTLMARQGGVVEMYEKLNYFRKHQISVTASSKQSDEAFSACMKECMDLTFSIEDFAGVSMFKRIFSYGQYQRLFRKQHFSRIDLKQELLDMLRKRCACLLFATVFYRIIQLLIKIHPHLNWIKSGRCQ